MVGVGDLASYNRISLGQKCRISCGLGEAGVLSVPSSIQKCVQRATSLVLTFSRATTVPVGQKLLRDSLGQARSDHLAGP